MSWFDALMLVIVAALFLFEMKQEAGRGLLDAVGTLAAVQLAALYAPWLTDMMNMKPLPGTAASPLAQGLLFVGFWALALGLSTVLHRQTRWSMDQFDVCFGVLFGLLVAVSVGHVVTDVAARVALMENGALPGYLQQSCFVGELRTFKSYHYVLDVFHSYQYQR